MLNLQMSRGTIVGELLAQTNLTEMVSTPGLAMHDRNRVYLGYDLISPLSNHSPTAKMGYRSRRNVDDAMFVESWFYDKDCIQPCGVTLEVTHHTACVNIKITIPFGDIEITLKHNTDLIDFIGLSRLENMSGEFSGCVKATKNEYCSEYLLEYSDMEVNTFSETIIVDNRCGQIVRIDSAENDQSDRAEPVGTLFLKPLDC